jgi:hypothetical protein
MIKLPIEIGDILLVGRFKNKRIKVKEIGTDEHGLPTVNGRGILKIRIEKLMEPKKNLKESTLYPELQKGSKIKVRKDDRSGIFINGTITDRKGNYISYKTSMGFGGINLEAKNLGNTIQFDSLKENMKKLTPKQKQLVKEYVKSLQSKKLNEGTNFVIVNLIKELSQKIEDAFEEFKDGCAVSNASFSEDAYDKAIHKAGKHFDIGIEILK